jgi:hypothetical protein
MVPHCGTSPTDDLIGIYGCKALASAYWFEVMKLALVGCSERLPLRLAVVTSGP